MNTIMLLHFTDGDRQESLSALGIGDGRWGTIETMLSYGKMLQGAGSPGSSLLRWEPRPTDAMGS